jgi:hypothetical protein
MAIQPEHVIGPNLLAGGWPAVSRWRRYLTEQLEWLRHGQKSQPTNKQHRQFRPGRTRSGTLRVASHNQGDLRTLVRLDLKCNADELHGVENPTEHRASLAELDALFAFLQHRLPRRLLAQKASCLPPHNRLVSSPTRSDIETTKDMPDELTKLEFSLDDVLGAEPLTPDNVDLPTLRGFLQDVETLIKGDMPGASLADSRVHIEKGSVKIVALVAQLLAADVNADLAKLKQTDDLDSIQPKRAQVLEQWQLRVRRSPSRVYSVSTGGLVHAIRITNTTQFQHGNENAWVTVEKYLTGKVVNAGGKQDPNVHLVLADSGQSVRVDATEQQLAAEKDNQLYKTVTLRVQAEQHLRTNAFRNLRLIQFSPQTTDVDEQALATLWEKGRKAWKDVKSAASWVESLRGNQ